MNDLLKNLIIDQWYKAVLAIGAIGIVLGLTIETKGITNPQLLIISFGAALIGLGEWINHSDQFFLKEPNAYTGPAAIFTYHIRQPKLPGILLDLAGILLIAAALYLIVSPLIWPARLPTD